MQGVGQLIARQSAGEELEDLQLPLRQCWDEVARECAGVASENVLVHVVQLRHDAAAMLLPALGELPIGALEGQREQSDHAKDALDRDDDATRHGELPVQL